MYSCVVKNQWFKILCNILSSSILLITDRVIRYGQYKAFYALDIKI